MSRHLAKTPQFNPNALASSACVKSGCLRKRHNTLSLLLSLLLTLLSSPTSYASPLAFSVLRIERLNLRIGAMGTFHLINFAPRCRHALPRQHGCDLLLGQRVSLDGRRPTKFTPSPHPVTLTYCEFAFCRIGHFAASQILRASHRPSSSLLQQPSSRQSPLRRVGSQRYS